MLVDSHCHLDFDDFEEDLDEIICRAKENGVTTILNAGNNIDELDRQLELSEKYPFIYTAVGVHPHNASEYENITAQDFIAKAGHKKVVGIGECGLDYYYDYSPRDTQIRIFREQIKAAQETGLPLIIHTRDADEDTMTVLDEEYKKKPFTGEIHGEFPANSLPTSMELQLKPGAQIIFIKNDMDKRWVNGTIGVVAGIDEDEGTIYIITDDGRECDVKREVWRNIRSHPTGMGHHHPQEPGTDLQPCRHRLYRRSICRGTDLRGAQPMHFTPGHHAA